MQSNDSQQTCFSEVAPRMTVEVCGLAAVKAMASWAMEQPSLAATGFSASTCPELAAHAHQVLETSNLFKHVATDLVQLVVHEHNILDVLRRSVTDQSWLL